MGGKPRKSRLPRQVRKIRAINRQFKEERSKKKPSKKKIAALVDEKDRLLNEMSEECDCNTYWVGLPDTSNPFRVNGHRFIIACQRCASSSFMDDDLAQEGLDSGLFTQEQVLPRTKFDVIVGKLCIRLGINIK